MKKVIMMSTLGFVCSGAALAQSNVTIYGVLDSYVGYTNAAGKGNVVSIDSGGYQASRLGFRGTEDLGGGLKANFVLENGFSSDSGGLADSTRLFNRQSWIGLSSSEGEIRAGRQNSPAFYMLGKMDAFNAATYGSFMNNISGYAPRYDNMIGYQSPSFSGFKVQAHVSLGEQVANQSSLNVYMLAAEYENGPLYLGLTTARQNSANNNQKVMSSFAGGSYDYGQGKIYLAYYHGNNLNAAAATNTPGTYYKGYSISANYRVTAAGTIGAGYGWATDESGAGKDVRQLSLIGTYDLSKRTMLYSTLASMRNSGGATFALSAGGPITRNVPTAGGTANGFQIGVRHLF